MNARCHRLIFNKARGQIMAVAESANGQGGGEGQRPGRGMVRFRVRRGIVSALALLFGLQSVVPAWAQIVADRTAPGNQQAIILNTANGLPQVNIQTPSAAGVSRNTYSQFDIGRPGAILNNARTPTQTQQGGWIQGNPYLATGSARVILNEVNSSNPSQLRGYLEVAGDKAQVIVANPAGIVCDGCGTINASRFTLTTGTPILNSGNLDGYLVRGGQIAIEGLGLDATRADYTDLIARAVQVNAGIWANTLNVTAGANRVDAAHSQVTPVTAEGAAPAFAIDVAALGGMYAGKIRLIGTEAGVGVRNAGQIGAQAGALPGDIALNADGQLTNSGVLSAAGSLNATSRGLDNSGTLAAQGNLALTSTGGVANSGVISASLETRLAVSGQLTNSGTVSGQRLDLSADNLDNSGTLQQTGTQALTVAAGNVFNTRSGLIGHEPPATGSGSTGSSGSGSTTSGSGSTTASAPSTSSGGGSVVATASAPVLLADGQIAIGGTLTNRGTLTANGSIALAAGGLANQGTLNLERLAFNGARFDNAGGKLSVSDLRITAATVDNTAGQLNVANQLALTANDLINRQGQIKHAGNDDLAIALSGTLDNAGGVIASNAANLTLTATTADNTGGRIEHAGAGTFTLGATQWQGTGGQLIANNQLVARFGQAVLDQADTSARQIDLTADSLSHRGGTLVNSGAGQGTVTVTHDFDNTGGTVSGAGALQISAATLDNTRGRIVSQDALSVAATQGTLTNDQGQLAAGTALSASAATTLANRGGRIENAGSGTLSVTATTLDNSGALIAGNGDTVARTQTLNNNGGSVSAVGTLTITAATRLDNTIGLIASGAALTLQTGQLDNATGEISALGALHATVTGATNNAHGLIASRGEVDLVAASLDNSAGQIVTTGGKLAVAIAGNTVNAQGKLLAAQDLTLATTGLDNTGGTVYGNTVTVDTRQQTLTNRGGSLSAATGARLDTGALDNDGGLIQSGDALAIDTHGQALSNRNAASHPGGGGLVAGGTLTVSSADLDNTTGYIGAQGPLTLSATNAGGTAVLDNAGGAILGAGSGHIATDQLNNATGQIQTVGDLQIAAGNIANTRGLLRSAATLELRAQSIDNRQTQGSNQGIEGNDVRLATAALDNTAGALRADRDLTLTSGGTLDNTQGWISAAGTLTVQDAQAAKTLSVVNTGGTLIAGQQLTVGADRLGGDGQLLAQHDLDLALNRDFTNSGTVQAGGNARIATQGTLTNSGKLLAGQTLTVQGAAIDNQAAGEIAGTTTRVTTPGTLTNRGLIDGSETAIDAGVLDNVGSGRIYGDHIGIAAGIVNNRTENGVSATIAARNRLDIGAGQVNNDVGALLFAAGDLVIGGALDANRHATGRAGSVTNNGGTLQALGALAITAQRIDNLNPNFAATVGPSGAAVIRATYVTDQGQISSDQIAWIGDTGGFDKSALLAGNPTPDAAGNKIALVLKGSTYDAPVYASDYRLQVYTTNTVTGLPMCLVSPELCAGTPEVLTTLSPADPIWARYGIAPPTLPLPGNTEPMWTDGPPDPNNPAMVDAYNAWQAAHDAWLAAAAPYIALQSALDAFRNSVNRTVYSYRNETYQPLVATVTSSTPGQILSGTSMTLDAAQSLTNDKSRIIAGGALSITGQTINNIAANISGTEVHTGTNGIWGYQGHIGASTGNHCDCDVYGFLPSAFTLNVPVTVSAPVGIVAQNTASATTGGAGALGAKSSIANAATTGTVTQANTPSANGPGNTANPGNPQSASGGSQAAGTTAQTVAQTVSPNLVLPSASLYLLHPAANSHILIETDPRFANYTTWLGSDYMLTSLGLDPAAAQKRLGDAFYEQQLIREQIGQLTGRRTLDGYGSDTAEYQALMNNGATVARVLNLQIGIALTAAQLAQLTSDIVWLVQESVSLPDGSTQTVLVPQVYLAPGRGDLKADGTLIAGNTLTLKADGDLVNSGTLAGHQVVDLGADNIKNLGGQIAGRNISLNALTDLDNIGGRIEGVDSLIVQAGRDINVTSTTVQTTGTGSAGDGRQLDRLAGLYVTGDKGLLLAMAGQDITLTGAEIQNDGSGSTLLIAGQNLIATTVVETSSTEFSDQNNHASIATRVEQGSQIATGGDLVLVAGANIGLHAADIDAGGDLTGRAGNALIIDAGHNIVDGQLGSSVESKSGGLFGGKRSKQIETGFASDTAKGSTLDAQNIDLQAGQIAIVGSTLTATQDLSLSADQINVLATTNASSTQRTVNEKSSGFLGGEKEVSNKAEQASTVEVSTLAGQNVTLRTQGGDLTLQAADIQASGTLTLDAGNGTIHLLTAQDSRQVQTSDQSSGTMFQSTSMSRQTDTTTRYNQLSAGQLDIGAGQLHVQGTAANLQAQAQQLGIQPGLEWMGQLANDPRIDWQQVAEIHDQWSKSHSGLSQTGGLLIALAVSIATAGMGVEVLGTQGAAMAGTAAEGAATATTATTLGGLSLAETVTTTSLTGVVTATTTYTAAGMAINAGFSTLVSEALTGLINNQGDIGATLKGIASKAGVQQLLSSMLTAGLGQGAVEALALPSPITDTSFANRFANYATRAAVATGVQSVVYGTPLSETAKDGLVTALAQSLTSEIGDWGNENQAMVAKTLAHAVVQCAAANAQGNSCSAAALGAVVAEAISPLLNGIDANRAVGYQQSLGSTIAGMAAILAAVIAGQDTATASNAAQMVDYYNRQLHPAEQKWIKENARAFAAQEGISEEEATKRLTQQALKEVDFLWRAQLSDGNDAAARAYLLQNGQSFVNELGERQKLFTAQGQQLFRPEMFAENADSAFYKQFAQSGISRSLSIGLMVELRDSGIDIKNGAIDLAQAAKDNPGAAVNAIWQAVQSLPKNIVDGFKEAGGAIGEGAAVAGNDELTAKLNALYGTDVSSAQRTLLAIRVAAALTGAVGTAKTAGSLTEATAKALGAKLDALLDQKALDALMKSGGAYPNGEAILDLKQLTAAQKGVMGELFGPETVKQIIPDGQKLARAPMIGETGIDDLYKVSRPDVDYVKVEYKFVGTDSKTGAQVLGKTNDGLQGSDGWFLGSGRLSKAVGDENAIAIENAIKSARTETWVVTTRPDGSTALQVLDGLGKPKLIDTSKILASGTNLSGAKP